jgi:hypothetical protein
MRSALQSYCTRKSVAPCFVSTILERESVYSMSCIEQFLRFVRLLPVAPARRLEDRIQQLASLACVEKDPDKLALILSDLRSAINRHLSRLEVLAVSTFRIQPESPEVLPERRR